MKEKETSVNMSDCSDWRKGKIAYISCIYLFYLSCFIRIVKELLFE